MSALALQEHIELRRNSGCFLFGWQVVVQWQQWCCCSLLAPFPHFEVFEDGTRQDLTHFSTQDFEAPPAHKSQLAARREPASQAQRTFLIVLGRGRLEPVSNGITGLVRFLEPSVDEADRVAILAYKRVTEFGLDRRSLIRLLERYAADHNAIEGRLDHFFLNRNITSDIDALFSSPGLPEMRELPPVSANECRAALSRD